MIHEEKNPRAVLYSSRYSLHPTSLGENEIRQPKRRASIEITQNVGEQKNVKDSSRGLFLKNRCLNADISLGMLIFKHPYRQIAGVVLAFRSI